MAKKTGLTQRIALEMMQEGVSFTSNYLSRRYDLSIQAASQVIKIMEQSSQYKVKIQRKGRKIVGAQVLEVYEAADKYRNIVEALIAGRTLSKVELMGEFDCSSGYADCVLSRIQRDPEISVQRVMIDGKTAVRLNTEAIDEQRQRAMWRVITTRPWVELRG